MCQLGITVCSLLILIVAEPAVHHLFEIPLHAIGVPESVISIVALAATLIVVTFLHVTVGEMVPKNFSVSMADKAVLFLAPPLMLISKAMRPIVVALNWIANHAVRALGLEPKDEVASSFTVDEVQQIVEESTRTGLVDDEAGLLSSAFEFSDQVVRDIAVPIDDVVTLDVDITPEEFERAVGRTGFSRFVMVDEDGDLMGYLHLKDVMGVPLEDSHRPMPITLSLIHI